jgi:methyl-accepting chemotaxis protein
MRRGAATTAKALSEQSVASGQVSVEASRLAANISNISKAMNEQAAGAGEITTAVGAMRQHSEELAKALFEQSRAMRNMTGASSDIAKNITLISNANREHSSSASDILQLVSQARAVADRNIEGVKATVLETAGLLDQALEVTTMIEILDARSEPVLQMPSPNRES